jgi:hypothetical protein
VCPWLTPLILAPQEADIRMSTNRSQFGQIVLKTLSQKYLTQNRPGRVARVIATLPSKHEALSSFKPQNHQKKKKKKKVV